MRTLWNIVAIFAVLNVLLFAGAVVWLKSTDRLSPERIIAVRERFARPLAQEEADRRVAEAAEKQRQEDAAAAIKMAVPPATAAEKIADERLRDDQRAQMLLRRQQIVDNMHASVMLQLTRLEEREKKLEQERTAFAAERRKIAEIEGDAQFQVALSTLEAQKARDAKDVLRAMLDQRQADQVVAYLAGMEEGKRGKVVAEFVKDSPMVAADLLERLRTRGILVPPTATLAQADTHEPTASPAANSPSDLAGARPAR